MAASLRGEALRPGRVEVVSVARGERGVEPEAGGEHEVDLVGGERVEGELPLLVARVGARRAPRRVDEHDIAVVETGERIARVVGIVGDFERAACQLGVGGELLEPRDAVGVEREEPGAPAGEGDLVRDELGDRGGLAGAGGADEGDHERAATGPCLALREWRAEESASERLDIGSGGGDHLDVGAGRVARDLDVEEDRVLAEHRRGDAGDAGQIAPVDDFKPHSPPPTWPLP